jgi:hypothetical protein
MVSPLFLLPVPEWHTDGQCRFLPGTLVMSLSIGMIISPKIEIYTQLVCRAVGPERSGTTLPEPMGAFEYDGMRVKTVHAVGTSGHGTGWYDAMWVQHHYEHAGPHHAAGEDYSIAQEQDTWSKQCRRSPQVQKAVTALVSPLSSPSSSRVLMSHAGHVPVTPHGTTLRVDDWVLGRSVGQAR